MYEIRKLFGIKGESAVVLGDDEGNLESLPEGEEDPTLANARLIDMIMKLKLLINENRRSLEGGDDEDSMHDAQQEKEELER